MKKLSILILTLMISFNSYGEWTYIFEGGKITVYIDEDTIKERGGYVYYWFLMDYLKPNSYGDFSLKIYAQNDCEENRTIWLSAIYYKEPMGVNPSVIDNDPGDEWHHESGKTFKYACDFVD